MRCDETRRRMQEALDGRPLDESASAHAAACDSCREYIARMGAVDAALREETTLDWDPALTARVLARVREQRRRARWLAAAAALLVAASLVVGARELGATAVVTEAGRAVSARIDLPETPEDAVRTFTGALTRFASSASSRSPLSPGPTVLVGAVLALILVNGLVIGRPMLARRRRQG